MLTNYIKKINVIFFANNLVVSKNCVITHILTASTCLRASLMALVTGFIIILTQNKPSLSELTQSSD